jgi:hypothetical protein
VILASVSESMPSLDVRADKFLESRFFHFDAVPSEREIRQRVFPRAFIQLAQSSCRWELGFQCGPSMLLIQRRIT